MLWRTDAAHLRDGAIGRDPRKRDPGKENARAVAINAIPVIITIVSPPPRLLPCALSGSPHGPYKLTLLDQLSAGEAATRHGARRRPGPGRAIHWELASGTWFARPENGILPLPLLLLLLVLFLLLLLAILSPFLLPDFFQDDRWPTLLSSCQDDR